MSLNLDAIDRLNFAVMEAFLALPRRGLEIGGLLLGNVRSDRDSTLVEIDDFEPVECDHATGPSYLFSRTDRAALEQRLRRDTSGKASIVGFFRSHTRDEFAARDADLDLMRNLFPDAAKVLLLIRPHRDQAADAGFVIWEDGEIRSPKPYFEFPFRRAALYAGGYQIVSRAGPGAVQETPARATAATASVAQELTPQLVWPESDRRQHWTWNTSRIRTEEWLVAAGLVVFAILSRVHGNLTPMQVQERASIPRIAVLAPPPESPAVKPSPPVVIQEKLQAPVIVPPRAVASRIEMRDRVTPRRRTMKPPPPLPAHYVEHLPAAPVPSAAAAYSPPSRMEALLAISESRSGPAASTKIPPVASPSAATPLVSVAVDPVRPPAPRGGVLHKLGFGGRSNPLPDFTPPKAIHEPAAELSPSLVRDMKEQVPVDVKVYIDRTGKVQYAELLSKGTGRDRDLASLAVFTSRHWEFSPARLEGEPVEAQVILHFRFGPESR